MTDHSEEYRRPAPGQWDALVEIRRSRFLALATRVVTEEDAREFIALARAEYPDARHHCSAFILDVEGSNPVERSSDDGEPSGTAGQPMLEVLRGTGLRDIAVVVVRWFGGIKLGTGGLVRAYQDATRAVLEEVTVVSHRPRVLWQVVIPHTSAGRVESELRNRGMTVTADYAAEVTLTLWLDPGEDPTGTVAGITGGTAAAHRTDVQWCDVRVPAADR